MIADHAQCFTGPRNKEEAPRGVAQQSLTTSGTAIPYPELSLYESNMQLCDLGNMVT